MNTPSVPVSGKNLWPFVIMVVIFLISLYVAGKARQQRVDLYDGNGQPMGTGIIRESWFNQKSK